MKFPLHHIGIVVPEIQPAADFYANLGFHHEGRPVHDPVQKVKIQFMRDGGNASRIELLEPAAADSPVIEALKRGGGLNHMCYEVENIEEALPALKAAGSTVISRIVPAPAISDCRVVFLFNRLYGIFELVESPGKVTGA